MSFELALFLLAQLGIALIIFASFYLIAHRAHLISFGHASFVALGMFMAWHLIQVNFLSELFFLLPATVAVLCGLVAWPIGLVLVRFSGALFAMSSLALAEILFLTAPAFVSLWGGDLGLSINRDDRAPAWASHGAVCALILSYVMVLAWGFYYALKSHWGLRCIAVRDNPLRAQHLGIAVQRVRVISFILASGMAGAAGALSLWLFEFVSVSTFEPQRSIEIVVFSFLAGGQWWGIAISAIAWVLAHVILPRYTSAAYLYLGIIFLVLMVWRGRQKITALSTHRTY